MNPTRRALLAVCSICALLYTPGIAAAQKGSQISDRLTVYANNRTIKVGTATLTETQEASGVLTATVHVPKTTFAFFEPGSTTVASDLVTFSGFNVKIESDNKGVAPDLGEVLLRDFVHMRMVSDTNEAKPAADTLTLTGPDFAKIELVLPDSKKVESKHTKIDGQTFRMAEPGDKRSDLVRISTILVGFNSDGNPNGLKLPPGAIPINSENVSIKAFSFTAVSAVPEGGTLMTFMIGLVALGWKLRRNPGLRRER